LLPNDDTIKRTVGVCLTKVLSSPGRELLSNPFLLFFGIHGHDSSDEATLWPDGHHSVVPVETNGPQLFLEYWERLASMIKSKVHDVEACLRQLVRHDSRSCFH
jgi:hypothetical protein